MRPHNIAEWTPDERQALQKAKEECLSRWKAATELARAIFAGRGRHGWRVEAERLLAASPELEAEARKALNRMMQK